MQGRRRSGPGKRGLRLKVKEDAPPLDGFHVTV